MELKEAINMLNGICGRLNLYLVRGEKQALQTAISHLETLQKVKEMGGIRKKTSTYHTCYGGSGEREHECVACEAEGFNEALDLIHAELTGKLEGLVEYLISKFPNAGLHRGQWKMINQAIRSHILGTRKKED